MALTLAKVLRLSPFPSIAFVGAGGKTTAMFQLARELPSPVIITSTTHLGSWQIPLADHHIVATSTNDLKNIKFEGITLITSSLREDDRTESIDLGLLNWLYAEKIRGKFPLLIEADGARQSFLKAPKEYEPPIPGFVDHVVVVAGLTAVGKPLSGETVYFPESYSDLSGVKLDQEITPDAIQKVLCSPQGGMKNIPPSARRYVFLNRSDTPELQSIARNMVRTLLARYDSVIISRLDEKVIFAAHEPVVGIILAAGGSERFGQTKQLLDWHGIPFIRAVALTALDAGLSQVIVVTGAKAELVEAAVNDLPVTIRRNNSWQSGQSSSIKTGIDEITTMKDIRSGAAIFLLSDQPQIEPPVIRALIEEHAATLNPIIAPMVLMEQRANPVLFDRVTFPDLMKLQGDIGGRGIFSKHHVTYMPWHDDRLLLDVDRPEDYERLIGDDTL